jgi:hypothetical protein
MTDWETRSLQYVVNAIESAEKRQHKLWKQIHKKRTKAGLIPIHWPAIEEYVEAVRRTHSLMIDLEMVGKEFQTKSARARKPARRPAAKRRTARRAK